MQVTLQEQRLCLNQQQGFCWQARDQERREFDAEVQALKHRLQQVEVDSWTMGVMIVFMVMLCSTALLLVVMNLAIAFCGWLWLVMDGYVFGWLWFRVRDLCQTYVVTCLFWHLVPIEGARFQWRSLFRSGGGAVPTEGGKHEKKQRGAKNNQDVCDFLLCVCFLGGGAILSILTSNNNTS